ncbi:hypothetical protein NLU13_2025 [Sarocladium strictum]|uniref:Uncharacterized protein n=1 Tax=Sarocladium strictum TaxID=5046 RepID=A0AA39GS19_SARSR|nr:hypothetical protein NLU13_2025 [Sarocladium strictum]
MPLRAPSQCRQTLARAPSSGVPSIWISDRMLFEAFQRYSLSSVRSVGADARCVHFNAGPLEHRRRVGKRRMTAVLPVSRLEMPAWFLPLAQDNSSPAWAPPTRPSERHQRPGLLNQFMSWLEDYPPDKPFLTPPVDEASKEIMSAESVSAGLSDTKELADLVEIMANLQEDLRSAPNDFKAQRVVLNRYYVDILPTLTEIAFSQTRHVPLDDSKKALLQALLSPFAERDYHLHGSVSSTLRVLAHWQGRIIRTFSDLAQANPQLNHTWILIEAAKMLCDPIFTKVEPGSHPDGAPFSDSFYHWCSSLKQLSRAMKSLPHEQQRVLIERMRHFLVDESSCDAVPAQSEILNARLGWAMILLWRPTSDNLKTSFDDIYSTFASANASAHRDERTFYLVMSELCLSLSISRDDFASAFAHHDKPSRWSALYATLVDQGERASRLLQKTNALLTRMKYNKEVAVAIRAETAPDLQRCIEGLVIAMGDYKVALQLHNERVSATTQRDASQPWSYQTWSLYINAMIQDPRVQITETTALIGSLKLGSNTATLVNQQEREGRAKLLEEMSYTLAYKSPKFRPWRVWKELQVWNQLYRRFTKTYSPKISQIMMDLTIKRLERGEVISTRRLKLMTNVVRDQAGEEQAQMFSDRITKWRNRNRYLGTEEQKFPLRFRRDLSPAEMAQEAEEACSQPLRRPSTTEEEALNADDLFSKIIKAQRVGVKPQRARKEKSEVGPQHAHLATGQSEEASLQSASG